MAQPESTREILTKASPPVRVIKQVQDPKKKDESLFFHPEWESNHLTYKKSLDGYNGGRSVIDEPAYLKRHTRERQEDFAFRLARAAYPNFSKQIIDLYSSMLTSTPATRTTEDAQIRAFQDNVDQMGNSIEKFFRDEIIPMSLIFGGIGVMIEMPSAEGLVTKLDELNVGHNPFAKTVLPIDIMNWNLDKDGKFIWVLIRNTRFISPSPFEATGIVSTFTLWTRETFIVLNEKGKAISPEIEHGLGEVPLFIVKPSPDKHLELMGGTFMNDAFDLNFKIYNLESLLDEFYYRQAFPVLVYPGELQQDTIGTAAVLKYDPALTAGNRPDFISPPVQTAAEIQAKIVSAKREMFRMAFIPNPNESNQVESGIAKEWDYQQLTERLGGLVDVYAHTEWEMYRLAGVWQDAVERWTDIKIEWPRDFRVKELGAVVKTALDFQTLPVGPIARKEATKRVVHTALTDLDQETLQQIDAQIDARPDVLDVIESSEREIEIVPIEGDE